MKKVIAWALVLVMVLGLCACGGAASSGSAAPASSEAAAPASSEAAAPASSEEAAPASSEEAAPSEGDGKVLKMRWHQAGGIDTLFESPWRDIQSILHYAIWETLLEWNSDGSYVGRLAEDYTVSDDGLTYTFVIRDGVKWHDGEPFTMDDVIWSLHKVCIAGQGTWSAGVRSIVGYQDFMDGKADSISGMTVDGNKLICQLAAPDRIFIYNICNARILPKHCLENVADENLLTDEAYFSKPVGTGPYMIDQVSFPDYCTMVAFPDYYGEQPGVKEVLFTSYQTGGNDAVTAALINGDLDFVWGSIVNDIEMANNIVAQNPDVAAMIQKSTYNRYLGFMLAGREDGKDKPDLLKKEVRQAFNLLIDKDAFASFYNGQAVALSTFMNPDSAAYNTDIPRFQRNVEEAKKLLDAANFDYSQVYDLAYYYDDQTTADAMAMLKQNFAEAGVQVEPYLMTGDLATAIYQTKNYDLGYFSNGAPVDANIMYEHQTKPGSATWMGQDDERGAIFDEPYQKWMSATTNEAAQEASNELQALGLEYCYMIPMYVLNTIEIYNTSVVEIPADIFEVDNIVPARNWKFSEWKMK